MAGDLRARREALGWTQVQVADAAGVRSAVYISMAECGRRLNDRVLKAIGDALTTEEMRRTELDRRERERATHRALAEAMPDGPEWRALRAAMHEHAVTLLDIGQGEACDAVLEFLPDAEATALLDRWLDEQMPDPAAHATAGRGSETEDGR